MPMPRLSSDALEAFAVFADTMNLTTAAAELRITQPSLYARIATLARELDRPLYVRDGRHLVLTADGEQLAQFARDQTERTSRFLDQLRHTPTSRPIVLAAGHVAYLHILDDVIRTTLAAQPGSLRMLHTDRSEMLDAVRTGRAHLGVAVLDALPTDLITLPIGTYPQVLLAPKTHRLARRRTVKLQDLAGEELVVPPAHRPHRIALERAMRTAGVPWTVAGEIEGWPLTVHCAALGIGLAIVTGCVTPPPGLVARRITDLPDITYHATHRRSSHNDLRLVALLKAINTRTAKPRRRPGQDSAGQPSTRADVSDRPAR